jgi:hypothetical protein
VQQSRNQTWRLSEASEKPILMVMARRSLPARKSLRAATAATAVVALVTMAAAMSAMPAATAATAQMELTATLHQATKVRAVAAAVAAAARDMLGVDRHSPVTPALLAQSDAWAALEGVAIALRAGGANSPPPHALLIEPLLDLPPPAC